eukprot:CAMPEP_0118990796 /NCGR_PEP_ID=MMETSP1173-20130426/50590_1 /TAXON_ID=1034831 /ORGANISM="Rhizochromulina marina cf, Strain CCMP1243" /LENGTH=33 /DNA_ID= /DNA_START= /DNA_END= /DNA_ORIENTATION=
MNASWSPVAAHAGSRDMAFHGFSRPCTRPWRHT